MGLSSELEKINFASDPNQDILSGDKNLNRLLKSVLKAVKSYAENQLKRIEQNIQIGLALSTEKNIDKLLEMIVLEARAMSNADAGTLYIKDKENKYLNFKIMQNDTMNVRMGGTSGVDIKLPAVPMYIDE